MSHFSCWTGLFNGLLNSVSTTLFLSLLNHHSNDAIAFASQLSFQNSWVLWLWSDRSWVALFFRLKGSRWVQKWTGRRCRALISNRSGGGFRGWCRCLSLSMWVCLLSPCTSIIAPSILSPVLVVFWVGSLFNPLRKIPFLGHPLLRKSSFSLLHCLICVCCIDIRCPSCWLSWFYWGVSIS